MSPVTRHLLIDGLVQGVGFRWSLCRQGEELGLRGWVRNRRDGRVEALIHGEAQGVERLTDWARHGPRAARVDTVEVDDRAVAPDDLPAGFEQRPTV